jgi:hypothetical protein
VRRTLPWRREVIALLVSVASASEGYESETVLQARHDFFGEPLTPFYQYLRFFDRAGPVDVAGYAGAEWSAGIDQPMDPELYLLEASGRYSWARWTLGRQQAIDVFRPQTFDGARVELSPSDAVAVDAWGGIARHHDLDDLADGEAIGRASLRLRSGAAALRCGLEIDPAATHGVQEDVEGRIRLGSAGGMPEARALVVLGGSDVRWSQLSLAASAVSGVRFTLQGEHRATWDPTDLLGESVVAAFAPESVDSVGLGVRVSDRTWSALSVAYSFDSYEQVDERVYGHAVDASYASGRRRSAFRVVPSYRFRAGPGGMFHAAYATALLGLSDATALTATAAVVPYRKLYDPWTTALAGGLRASERIGSHVTVTAGADAARDATYTFDLRASGTLLVTL